MRNLIYCIWYVLMISCTQKNHKDSPITINKDMELFNILKQQDSILFEIGFNTCNIAVTDSLVADDFEFYHDQSGIIPSKEAFLNGTREGLCNLDYQPIRKLIDSTLQVFPLKNEGQIYGALQLGSHQFFAKYQDQDELKITSEAKFNHLWLLQENKWKLSRVFSYDHIPVNQ